MKTIRIRCESNKTLLITEIHDFQGDLKELSKENYESLKNEILTTGFSFAPHVWLDENDQKFYLVDGHQRLRVLRRLSEESYQIPPIPVVVVQADDLKQAKRRVLQGTSQYGIMKDDGLYEFMQKSEIDFSDIKSFRLPDIDTDKFRIEFDESVEKQLSVSPDELFETELDDKNDYIVFYFDSKDSYQKACDKYGIKRVDVCLSRNFNPNMITSGMGRVLSGEKLLENN